MDDDFLQAFREVVREQLIQHNKVHIKELGIFNPVHLSQRKWEYKNGKVVLLPPKEYVEFQALDNTNNEEQS